MTKVVSFYLPQFHSIPENDAIWGKGFTEWTNVRAAKSLMPDHYQPREPLNDNYYSLLDEDTIAWQADIAKDHGVYGWCIYHYWFNRDKMILNKPLELLHHSKKIHFPYCICWANESWTNAWVSKDKPKDFLKQEYGNEEDWRLHFNYLLQYFSDPDYITEDNKPMMVIYRPETIPDLNERLDYWNQLAKEHGFDGLTYAYQQIDFEQQPDADDSRFRYSIEYQPKYAQVDTKDERTSSERKAVETIKHGARVALGIVDKLTKSNFTEAHNKRAEDKAEITPPKTMDYQMLCEAILRRHATNEKSVAGMFVGYDDTPRRGNRGTIIQSTPEQFKHYFGEQLKNVRQHYQTDYLFLFAWNEWAEGGYLEPDKRYGYAYLDAIKACLEAEEKSQS